MLHRSGGLGLRLGTEFGIHAQLYERSVLAYLERREGPLWLLSCPGYLQLANQ